jgi:hypothetical protein
VRLGDQHGIAAGQGVMVPVSVQPENRREQSWEEFLRGARLPLDALFTTS